MIAVSTPFRSPARSSAVLLRSALSLLLGVMVLVMLVLTASHVLPNAGQIAYISSQDGEYKIYLMDVGRTLSQKLSNHAVLSCCLSWSPDGTRLGLMMRVGLNNEIFLMEVESGKMQQMTRHSGSVQNGLVWSPDGQRLLVVSADGSYSGSYMLNVDSGEREFFNAQAAYGQSPRWSPDGQEIVFTKGTEGQLASDAVSRGLNTEIFVVDNDGNDAKAITPPETSNLSPVWSFDSQQIAFVSVREKAVQIYATGRDGGVAREVTHSDSVKWSPLWSPDGKAIAFVAQRDGEVDVFMVEVSSGVERQLTHNKSVWEWNISWSPDGHYLLYEANPSGNFGVYLVNVADETVRSLTPNPAYANNNSIWRP